jgi:transposase InsO family protein
MIGEVRPEYPSDWPAMVAAAQRLGIGSAETLRKWVRQAEVDAGQRPGVTHAESVIGLCKTELIKPRGPWRTAEQIELASLSYVDWFNHRRLYEMCGDIPPAELEDAYYRQNTGQNEAA